VYTARINQACHPFGVNKLATASVGWSLSLLRSRAPEQRMPCSDAIKDNVVNLAHVFELPKSQNGTGPSHGKDRHIKSCFIDFDFSGRYFVRSIEVTDPEGGTQLGLCTPSALSKFFQMKK
jgi:hypothetical protein